MQYLIAQCELGLAGKINMMMTIEVFGPDYLKWEEFKFYFYTDTLILNCPILQTAIFLIWGGGRSSKQ